MPLNKYGIFHFFIFNALCLMTIITHLRGCIADPGYIPKHIEVPDYVDTAQLNCCEKCQMRWKPQRAHHCSECGLCIFKMDHHCPWINNCVGQRNYKYFMLFVFYTLCSSLYLCVLLGLSFYFLLTDKNSKTHMRHKNYSTAFMLSIGAFVEGVLFTIFTWELLQE